ncbi:MAG: hypothetical protein WAN11_05450 [Syntrophobacteraceae bacterium]
MGRTVKSLELRTAEGKLIVSLYLVEKEVDSEGKQNTGGNKRSESKSGNHGNGSQNGEAMTEAQRRYLFRILAEQGIEEDAAFEKLKSLFDVNALKDVTKRDASKMIERLLEDQGG